MRLVVTMIMGSVLRGRVLLIDLCMWTHNGARTLPVVLDNKAELERTRVKPKKGYCPHFSMGTAFGTV